ncbi:MULTISPECIES: IclR family transcriptional regulator [Rhodococcus]|uniref:IclR family transcriptional regulator n=1 Tax=Rhodococcus TaxID=1827 RepID=UPI001E50F97C|nr:IclR family transcriptional regulator [Rhodococcus pyridinivorans]MCD2119561.1 IclR family transcriptional regulator [Rhodococcus pyridinivorans]MCZ4628437.1 IclR family transcriptional regulator [Rhodococcus pyridinivorans]MCZ4649710.1 IclR family transcriptional regulator [Rhodococcus pyridinivorans]MDJ0484348.1 IclR family transcriptional regulator [Rhodococcus pyridinivorans]MDV7255744.1 IclR family transcriptional regulator [Rhodococcus pyridinivorans]
MNSVLTALRVFEEVATTQPVGLSELSKRLDVPKSTVQRCLRTLAEAGWLRPSTANAGQWVITGRAFSLGSAMSSGDDLREVALPELNRLQAETGETVHLAVPDGNELVLIERLDSPHQLRAFLALGTRLPLHAASTGKAYLASLPDERIENFLATELPSLTEHTVTDPAALREEIAEIRARGYAVTEQGLHDGIAAVAVALRGRGGTVRGCFSISGPASRLTPDLFADYGAKALAARDAIERRLP